MGWLSPTASASTKAKTCVFSVRGTTDNAVVLIDETALGKHFLPVNMWILVLLEIALQRLQFVQEPADATKFLTGLAFGMRV
jgi:hypothetical protein